VCGVVSAGASAVRREFDPAHGWSYALACAALAAAVAWGATARRPDRRGLTLATTATAAALIAGTIVRESPRLEILERSRPTALHTGGAPVFFITLVLGIAAIAWVIRTVRGAGGYSGGQRDQ
jgi:hypothetical protein